MTEAVYKQRILCSIAVLGLLCFPRANAGNCFVTKELGNGWVLMTPVPDPSPNEEERIQRAWTITAEKIQHPTSKGIVAFGKVVVVVQGQNAHLKADEVEYARETASLTARGHVQIFRRGVVTKVSVTRFKVASPEYIVTEPHVQLCEPELKVCD